MWRRGWRKREERVQRHGDIFIGRGRRKVGTREQSPLDRALLQKNHPPPGVLHQGPGRQESSTVPAADTRWRHQPNIAWLLEGWRVAQTSSPKSCLPGYDSI